MLHRAAMGERRIHPVVLCGGSGTRLWPLSRALYPKQLLALASERALFQDTVLRAADATLFAPPVVVGNEEHRFILAEQLREIGVAPRALVVEPTGRNTAPAAAVAALLLTQDEGDALMLVMPADHVIADAGAFAEAVGRALAAARAGRLVTFGITRLPGCRGASPSTALPRSPMPPRPKLGWSLERTSGTAASSSFPRRSTCKNSSVASRRLSPRAVAR